MPLLLLSFALFFFSAPAFAVYKCEFAGKVAYSDIPCRDGKMKELSIAPPLSDQDEAQQRLAQDKQQLQELETQRHRQEAIDERKWQRQARARQAHEKKCAELAQRRKWAEEYLANAGFRSRGKAQTNVRRAEEKYQLACED